jgi:hypothetical protein
MKTYKLVKTEMTRLERAKAHYENEVECSTPTVENSLFEIKRGLLSECFDEFFEGKPTSEEQKWIDAELAEIEPFLATEYF